MRLPVYNCGPATFNIYNFFWILTFPHVCCYWWNVVIFVSCELFKCWNDSDRWLRWFSTVSDYTDDIVFGALRIMQKPHTACACLPDPMRITNPTPPTSLSQSSRRTILRTHWIKFHAVCYQSDSRDIVIITLNHPLPRSNISWYIYRTNFFYLYHTYSP